MGCGACRSLGWGDSEYRILGATVGEQFSVSGQNVRSQKAVERIGAVKEGTFRKHRVKPDGTIHDNVFYSIVDSEWDAVRKNLVSLLEKKY